METKKFKQMYIIATDKLTMRIYLGWKIFTVLFIVTFLYEVRTEVNICWFIFKNDTQYLAKTTFLYIFLR